jgi:hypothetical protein
MALNSQAATTPGVLRPPVLEKVPMTAYTRNMAALGTGSSTVIPSPALADVPRVTTETGWFTQGTYAISEDQQGKLFLNLFLAQYKRGWRYTFIYLHNLTAILADNVTFAPSSLNYSIPNEPATVHDLLIQKSTGTFELAVWDERVSGRDTVTVNLGRRFSTVAVYDPTLGASPTQSLKNVSSVQLTLSDHPMIIEITH